MVLVGALNRPCNQLGLRGGRHAGGFPSQGFALCADLRLLSFAFVCTFRYLRLPCDCLCLLSFHRSRPLISISRELHLLNYQYYQAMA